MGILLSDRTDEDKRDESWKRHTQSDRVYVYVCVFVIESWLNVFPSFQMFVEEILFVETYARYYWLQY